MNGGQALVGVLEQLGVSTIFGLCGDTSLPWYEALAASRQIRHVLTRDERSAAFMADAYARLSGRVGVCEGPSGGGATYILPGVAEANESSVPMVCMTSDIATTERGKGTLTDLDQAALFAPVTKRVFSPRTPKDLPRMTRAAFRAASSGSLGACQIALPLDTQAGSVPASAVHGDAGYSRYPATRVAPRPPRGPRGRARTGRQPASADRRGGRRCALGRLERAGTTRAHPGRLRGYLHFGQGEHRRDRPPLPRGHRKQRRAALAS